MKILLACLLLAPQDPADPVSELRDRVIALIVEGDSKGARKHLEQDAEVLEIRLGRQR